MSSTPRPGARTVPIGRALVVLALGLAGRLRAVAAGGKDPLSDGVGVGRW